MKKTYSILDASGRLIGELLAESAHVALKEAKTEVRSKAKTAIIKTEWERTEKLSKAWLLRSSRVEA